MNKTKQVLHVNWLDFQGNRRLYFDLPVGATRAQATFVGHQWLVSDQTDQCAQIAPATGPTTTVTVRG